MSSTNRNILSDKIWSYCHLLRQHQHILRHSDKVRRIKTSASILAYNQITVYLSIYFRAFT